MPTASRIGRRAVVLATIGSGAFASAPAWGQVRWDVGGEAGLMKRFTTGSSPGASSPSPGPMFELRGHVAVVPMVRVGLYAAMSLSPRAGAEGSEIGERTYWEGGLEVRVIPPLLPAPWRTWAFAGAGWARTYAASFRYSDGTSSVPDNTLAQGAYGGLIEVPLGIGLGSRVTGAPGPWGLFVEAGGRGGAGFYGPVYAGPPRVSSVSHDNNIVGLPPAFDGNDSFALTVSLGLSFDR